MNRVVGAAAWTMAALLIVSNPNFSVKNKKNRRKSIVVRIAATVKRPNGGPVSKKYSSVLANRKLFCFLARLLLGLLRFLCLLGLLLCVPKFVHDPYD